MKRFIALLLALLLPLCTFAESVEVTVQVKASDALFSKLFSESFAEVTGFDTAALQPYASIIKALLSDVSITAVSQANAYSVDFILRGVTLFDMTAYQNGSVTQMTSTLIPGYMLEEQSKEIDALTALTPEKQKNILTDVKAAYEKWYTGLNAATISGVFDGDAYTGGTKCTTWTVTDQDISALLSAVMTPELRTLFQQELAENSEGEADILAAFDAANDRVARENRCSYLVRSVKDDHDELIGFSVSILEKDIQTATVSVGLQEDAIRIVMGLGLRQQNYWAEWNVTTSRREEMTFIKGEMREWTADKSETFAYVKETNAPVVTYLLNCNVTNAAQRTHWDGHLYKGSTALAEKEVLSFNGAQNQTDKSYEASVSLMENKQTLLSLTITKKEAEAIQQPDSALIRCSADDPEQQELYTKITQTFAFAITARLMQVIPFDALLMMDELFQ